MLLAIAAQKFGCRPSSLVALHDPVLALDFDLAAAAKLLNTERAAVNAMNDGLDETQLAGRQTRNVDW